MIGLMRRRCQNRSGWRAPAAGPERPLCDFIRHPLGKSLNFSDGGGSRGHCNMLRTHMWIKFISPHIPFDSRCIFSEFQCAW